MARPDSPEIISPAEAKAKGLKRYFTGKPCKRGHVCERYIYANSRSGPCIQCALLNRERYEREHPENRSERTRRYKHSLKGREKSRLWHSRRRKWRMENEPDYHEKEKRRNAERRRRKPYERMDERAKALLKKHNQRARAALLLIRELGIPMEVLDDIASR